MLLMESLVVGVICPTSTCDVTITSTAKSLAEQVIEVVEPQMNNSLSICIYPDEYNATNNTTLNFYDFSNIVIQKDPSSNGEVTIRCPDRAASTYNGLGFFNAENIIICGLSFTGCGPLTSGVYFERSQNVKIMHSVFHHNINTGVGINFGKNFTILNCTFTKNVGIQPDDPSYLIQDLSYKFGGAGLGISLENTSGSNIVVENCTFENNIAHKTMNGSGNDTRSYHYVPFGSGAAIYIRMKNTMHCSITVTESNFYNNTASHQGGAIAIFLTDSKYNLIEIKNCTLSDNKAIGYFLVNQDYDDLDKLMADVNINFNVDNFGDIVKNAKNVSSKEVSQTGGVAGSLLMTFYDNCEFNRLCIKDSIFRRNLAFGAAGFGFFGRSSLSNVNNGLNSNQASVDQ